MTMATAIPTATALDPHVIRKDFPALLQNVHGKPLVYLDNAATSQKPERVIRALTHYLERDNANVHRGIHHLSFRATEAYEGARSRVAEWLGAATPKEVIWTRGATEAINLVASSWGPANLREGDEILLTTLEHHSNIVPWQLLAGRTGARLRYIEMDDEGSLRLDMLPEVLTDRTRLVAIGHISNALGTINPVAEIAAAAHAQGALVLVDGAQGAPHFKPDVKALGCDFYAFSSHKMVGPTGIGALWARMELLEEMPPYQGGGEMIDVVGRESTTWATVPSKFEAGTPHIAGAIGAAVAISYLERIGYDAIARHEHGLLQYATDRLEDLPGIRILGPKDLEKRSAVVSFLLEDAHPHDVAQVLDSEAIAIRAGHHCAQLVMEHFGVAATSRASFYLYNTEEDVDRLREGLEKVIELFGRR